MHVTRVPQIYSVVGYAAYLRWKPWTQLERKPWSCTIVTAEDSSRMASRLGAVRRRARECRKYSPLSYHVSVEKRFKICEWAGEWLKLGADVVTD